MAAPYSLIAGDSVNAKVKAINAVGASGLSDNGSGAVIVIPTAPSQVTGLQTTSQSATSITVSWTAPS